MEKEKNCEDIYRKNIEFAAEIVAGQIFYHVTEVRQKQELKKALLVFAATILKIKKDEP